MGATTMQIKSISELRHIQKEIEVKVLQVQELQHKLEIAEQERIEKEKQAKQARIEQERQANQERLETERRKAYSSSKANINSLADRISNIYSTICSLYNERLRIQEKLEQKREDYNLFLETMNDAYPVKEDFDGKKTAKMRNRLWAYYGLPIADILFAYLAIMPIVQSKLIAAFPEIMQEIMPVIGAVLAIALALLLTLFGRWGRSSTDDIEWYKSPLLIITCTFVPIIYWMHFILYTTKGASDIAYTSSFSFVSLVIQLWIVAAYQQHIQARAYFKDKKKNDSIRAVRDKQNEELNAEIQEMSAELEAQPAELFDKFFLELGSAFRQLASCRNAHINEYNEEPSILLSWNIIYVGNAIIFQKQEFPMPEINQDIPTMSDIYAIEDMLRLNRWDVHLVKWLLITLQPPEAQQEFAIW